MIKEKNSWVSSKCWKMNYKYSQMQEQVQVAGLWYEVYNRNNSVVMG